MGLDGKKTRLKDAEITKVDAVLRGAQADSHIVICKSDDDSLVEGCIDHIEAVEKLSNENLDRLKLIVNKEMEENNMSKEDEVKKAAADEAAAAVEAEKVTKAAAEEVEAEKAKKAFDLKAKLKAEEEAKAEKAGCMIGKEAPAVTVEEVLKMFQVQKAENDQLKQAVAKMADEKVEKEYIEKAAEFEGLSISATEFGPVLKAIAIAVPEAYAKLEAVLKAANQAIISGDMFTEIGTTSTFTSAVSKSDAWGQIAGLADAAVAKDGTVTQAKAIEEVLKTSEGRKLYAIYTGKLA